MNEKFERIGKEARSYHKLGLNCAECVVRSILNNYETGLPDEVITMASGFGGGIGRSRHICGAVTGTIMALGLMKGRKDPFAEDRREVVEVYPDFKEMFTELEEFFGTVICKDMLRSYNDENGNKQIRSCDDTIEYCAAKVCEYIERPIEK